MTVSLSGVAYPLVYLRERTLALGFFYYQRPDREPPTSTTENTSMTLQFPKSYVRAIFSTIQNPVNAVQIWSIRNNLQLNNSKCKELRVCFTRPNHAPLLEKVEVCGCQLEIVTHVWILGLTISSDLKWNKHIFNTIKKANKRFTSLKRAKVPNADILNFYCASVRQVLEYGCQVFHYGLPIAISRAFTEYNVCTNGFLNTFIPSSVKVFNRENCE